MAYLLKYVRENIMKSLVLRERKNQKLLEKENTNNRKKVF